VTLEPFLADKAAEMVGFTLISYFKLGCVVVQNCSTHGVSVHYFRLSSWMNLFSSYLLLMVRNIGKKEVVLGAD
jgi:hypothetical protein